MSIQNKVDCRCRFVHSTFPREKPARREGCQPRVPAARACQPSPLAHMYCPHAYRQWARPGNFPTAVQRPPNGQQGSSFLLAEAELALPTLAEGGREGPGDGCSCPLRMYLPCYLGLGTSTVHVNLPAMACQSARPEIEVTLRDQRSREDEPGNQTTRPAFPSFPYHQRRCHLASLLLILLSTSIKENPPGPDETRQG